MDNSLHYASQKNKVQPNNVTPEIESAEVIDIILDNAHPEYNSINDIGKVKVRRLTTDFNKSESALLWAKPHNLVIKQFPLKHEFIILLKGPSEISGHTLSATSFYYLPVPIAVHTLLNYNPVPKASISSQIDGGNNQASNFTGIESKNDTVDKDLKFGDTFKENPDITKLRPFEGDTIIEGRFGNSIRFGSTIKDEDFKRLGVKEITTWGVRGNNGDPLIIIRNGLTDKEKSDKLKIEDINEEKSSIWLTTSQLIGLKLTSLQFGTFGIKNSRPVAWPSNYRIKMPEEYSDRQVIINSGRIILHASEDSILLNSRKSISLSTDGSIHINSKDPVLINGDKIHLGLNSRQPAILGDKMIDFLRELLIYLMSMDIATPVGPGLPGPGAQSNFSSLLNKLELLKCKVVRVE